MDGSQDGSPMSTTALMDCPDYDDEIQIDLSWEPYSDCEWEGDSDDGGQMVLHGRCF